MGERKGTNKYYPPDYDPKKGGLNKFMGTHALRERARKLHLGIMIIRFEMPYNIWCEGCNNHIGMGVRYNAEKSKIGMYYSTPVYQFRMKCHLCDNHFEIKTDPANLDYVILNGARRQERRWDPTDNGQVVPDDKQVIHKLADDAMFKLQHGVEDQKKMKDVTPTLSKLENLQERWKDDYMANKALRDIFRSRKRELQDQHNKDKEFLKKRSLDIPLLQETEDDAKVASLIRLQPAQSVDERQKEKRSEIDKKSQFPFPLMVPAVAAGSSSSVTTTSKSTSELNMDKSQHARAPNSNSCLQQRRLLLGIKLKTDTSSPLTHALLPKSDKPLNNDDFIPPVNEEKTEDSVCLNEISKDENVKTAVTELVNTDEESKHGNNLKSTLQLNAEDGTNDVNAPKNSYNTQPSASSKFVFSSLVSYSDDSENSSSMSGSENEETR